ncbi:hypothetical protein D9M72_300530 [compost metagenome]
MLLTFARSPARASAGVNQASACSVAATMLRWVSTAPFDRPVVPPVYCRKAIESSVLWSGPSVRPRPSAIACLNGVTVRPSLRGSL